MNYQQQIPDGFGTTKISDGLYIGDELASKDIDTIVINHITHIINCSASQVPNHFQSYGICYLSFAWLDTDRDILLDQHDRILNDITNFINEAAEMGQSCLIHTKEGYSTSFTLFAGFFMNKFHWTLYKALEFLDSRVPKVEIKTNSFKQLKSLQSRLFERYKLSNDWTHRPQNPDELIMRNTYVNCVLSRLQPAIRQCDQQTKPKKKSVVWRSELEESRPPDVKRNHTLKSILKTAKQIAEGNDKKDEENRESQIKLSVKKKSHSNQPGKPEDKKVIHLFVNSNMPRGGSEKKIADKGEMKTEQPRRQQKSGSLKSSDILKKMDLNVCQNKSKLVHENKRVLKSEMSQKDKNSDEAAFEYPPFIKLFRNDSQNQQNKLKQEVLNRSAETLQDKSDIGKRIRFQTQISDCCPKDELAKKLLKKMTLVKAAGYTSEDKQNKEGVKPQHSGTDDIFRQQRGFQTLNLKSNDVKRQQRVSEDEAHKIIQKTNNFVEEPERPMGINKSTRNESPAMRNSKENLIGKSSVDKIRTSVAMKGTVRPASPSTGQPKIGVKEANTIISSIFARDGYKPKWKF